MIIILEKLIVSLRFYVNNYQFYVKAIYYDMRKYSIVFHYKGNFCTLSGRG